MPKNLDHTQIVQENKFCRFNIFFLKIEIFFPENSIHNKILLFELLIKYFVVCIFIYEYS